MAVDVLSSVKNWIYILCTPTNIFAVIFGLIYVVYRFWWDKINRKEDLKREDQRLREQKIQKEEDRQRADAEKIAEIYEQFYNVENKFLRLKKSLEILRKRKIVNDLTEFHVLIYMCRKENWKKFHRESIDIGRLISDPHYRKALESPDDSRDYLLSDVKEIMKFILDLRIKLFSIRKNQTCLDDIKLEFSGKFIEMGESVYPFVQKHQQDVIERALEYFDIAQTVPEHEHLNDEHENLDEKPGLQNQSPSLFSRYCRIQQTSKDETKRPANDTIIELQPTTSASSHSPTAIQPSNLMIWPGNAEIENAIPYLKCFAYPKYGEEMTLKFVNIHSDILHLMHLIEVGVIKENDGLLHEIDKLWKVNGHEPPGGGLLHSIRMIMYKLCTHKINLDHHDFFNRCEGSVDDFRKFIRNIINVDTPNSENVRLCKNMLVHVGILIGLPTVSNH
ncbi:uncharacterized protein LOC124444907 isoform X2 [Xenia sp. Carnegie-2017]|uniref:uncharacterized protein LOC124444907 isoform X2 n=1 Tax=Xenia sp. Carnegie-2017 TaxID=2897299 RepID=UPI001F04D9F8|nr:uncharacterized protein LOC124444907 isoform X2 [Xenia sp. Carnegie-2017]